MLASLVMLGHVKRIEERIANEWMPWTNLLVTRNQKPNHFEYVFKCCCSIVRVNSAGREFTLVHSNLIGLTLKLYLFCAQVQIYRHCLVDSFLHLQKKRNFPIKPNRFHCKIVLNLSAYSICVRKQLEHRAFQFNSFIVFAHSIAINKAL